MIDVRIPEMCGYKIIFCKSDAKFYKRTVNYTHISNDKANLLKRRQRSARMKLIQNVLECLIE